MNVNNSAYNIFSSSGHFRGNYSNNTYTGAIFNQNCTGINIENNQMDDHFFDDSNTEISSGDLYIGFNGQIGSQSNKFNRFTGNGQSVAVRHPSNPNLDLFIVHQAYISSNATPSQYYPIHDPISDPDCIFDNFFRCDQSITIPQEPSSPCGINTGGSTILGMMISNPEGATDVANALINGNLNYAAYNQESQFEISKIIDQGLKEFSITLPDTGIYVNWKDSLTNSNGAKLNAFSNIWTKQNQNSEFLSLSNLWQQASKLAFDSTIAYMSEINVPEDFETENWHQKYIQLRNWQNIADSLHNLLLIAEENLRISKKDSASYWNQSLTNLQDYEIMEQTINQIYLNTLARGIYYFSPQQKEQISQIAWECPLKSAGAVYRARGMYALIDPFVDFDNYAICANQGMQFRLGNANQNNSSENIVFNQSAEQLQINHIGEGSISNLRIINSIGQTIIQLQFAAAGNQKQQTIDLNSFNLNNGMYVLQATGSNGKASNHKFIYTK